MNPWLYIAKKRKEEKIKKAAAEILKYCGEHEDCIGCMFYVEVTMDDGWNIYNCSIENPQNWELEE